MEIVTLNPYDTIQNKIIEESKYKKDLEEFSTIRNKYSQKEYNLLTQTQNEIFECLLLKENNSIKDYCIFKGTKDNRLIQMKLSNSNSKELIKVSISYAFSILNAHTITVFSEKENTKLEAMGFESLGKVNGQTTYIKENIEMEIGRVRK